MREGGGSTGTEYTEIAANADSLDTSVVFHVVKDVLAFVLFMHQQIPSILQDMSLEFNTMQTEYEELETALTQAGVKATFRRQQIGRMREIKRGVKRIEKLMNSVSGLVCALQHVLSEIPAVEEFILVLGASSIRPQHMYELCFSHGNAAVRGAGDFIKSRATEALSRKTIRALISKGAGSGSYLGPTKLFLLVKAPTSFNMPLHFLPKRDFRYCKKVTPFRLRLKCRSHDLDPICCSQTDSCTNLRDSAPKDSIWFQCRHVVKGLAFKTPSEE